MTFKHIKFEDSAVMRSLEKLYKEKGLLKEEPIKKKASSKLDLRASLNLMENILKLCNGLRSYGLDKQANELELNYLSYKKANTLYETSKETGEDLVHSAHPKGSHKVDVLGDDLAVVETILDNHLKMLKVVNKEPTGKLASNNIINSVKKALGSDPEGDIKSLTFRLNSIINGARENLLKLKKFILNLKDENMASIIRNRSINSIDFILGDLFENINLNELKRINLTISNLNEIIKPNWYSTDTENASLNVLNPFISKIKEDILTVIWIKKYLEKKQSEELLNQHIDSEKKPEKVTEPLEEPAQLLIKKFKDSLNLIGLYKARVIAKELSNSANLIQWLDGDATSYFDKYSKELEASKYKSDPDVIASYTKKLNDGNSKLETFRQKWL